MHDLDRKIDESILEKFAKPNPFAHQSSGLQFPALALRVSEPTAESAESRNSRQRAV
jgi:hypothetical protein